MFQAYLIRCIVSDRAYVGITSRTLKQRWAEHIYDARRRKTALARAIVRHGKDQFVMEAICSFRSWADACDMEGVLIEQHGTAAPRGYNIRPGGEGVAPGLVRTVHQSSLPPSSPASYRGFCFSYASRWVLDIRVEPGKIPQ